LLVNRMGPSARIQRNIPLAGKCPGMTFAGTPAKLRVVSRWRLLAGRRISGVNKLDEVSRVDDLVVYT
jgi:hypothetical protein